MVFAGCVLSLMVIQPPSDAVQPGPEAAPIQRPMVEAPVAEAAPEAPELTEPQPEAPPPQTEAAVVESPTEPAPVPPPEPVATASAPEPLAAPEPLPPTAAPVSAEPVAPPVELPERDGRGLIRGALGASGVAWALSITTAAAVARGCPRCTTSTVMTVVGLRWISNGAALGLSIPGAIYRGRYNATAAYLGQRDAPDSKRHIRIGATVLGLGSTLWLVTRALGTSAFLEDPLSWRPGAYAGYFMSLQAGWTAAAAGAGLLSYGLSSEKEEHRLGRLASVHVLPQLGVHDAGIAVAGRF